MCLYIADNPEAYIRSLNIYKKHMTLQIAQQQPLTAYLSMAISCYTGYHVWKRAEITHVVWREVVQCKYVAEHYRYIKSVGKRNEH